MKLFLSLMLVSSVAMADDALLLRCRGLADPAARLACYDALVIVPNNSGTTSTNVNSGLSPRQAPSAQRALPQQMPDQFGLEQRLANEGELDSIESHIPGQFEGWGPKSRIRLANGQIWQISDDSARIHDIANPKIKIRRGVFGAFYLEIEGTNASPKVKRVQ